MRVRVWHLVAILVLVGAATTWVFNPPGLSGSAFYGAPVPVGQQLLGFGGFPLGDRTIQLRSVEAVLSPDSAAAEIKLAVCREAVLMAFGDFDNACSEVYAVEGATIDGLDLEVVIGITPLEPGIVHIEGFDVSYREGIRFGSDRVPAKIEIEGKPRL